MAAQSLSQRLFLPFHAPPTLPSAPGSPISFHNKDSACSSSGRWRACVPLTPQATHRPTKTRSKPRVTSRAPDPLPAARPQAPSCRAAPCTPCVPARAPQKVALEPCSTGPHGHRCARPPSQCHCRWAQGSRSELRRRFLGLLTTVGKVLAPNGELLLFPTLEGGTRSEGGKQPSMEPSSVGKCSLVLLSPTVRGSCPPLWR